MVNDFKFFEGLFFRNIEYIKRFNGFLMEKYNLNDIPYNIVGKPFSKIGEVEIDGGKVSYRFHGRGVTLFWDGVEIFCDFDTGMPKHPIIVSSWGWYRFLATFLEKVSGNLNNAEKLEEQAELALKEFADIGILITRDSNKAIPRHVNENWYQSYKDGTEFKFDNMDDIDWVSYAT